MAEFRVEYSIKRAEPGSDEFIEIGFGSSTDCADIDSALYEVQSAIQNRLWETQPGMPDPDDIGGAR